MENFKIKMVEPIPGFDLTRDERLRILEKAGYNHFALQSEQITIDLLTDSGTGSMSSAQWSAIMLGDETYAGASSFRKFKDAIQTITGFRYILPTHQGRAAEKILFQNVGTKGDVIPSNGHFDTTRAHVELTGTLALDLRKKVLDPRGSFNGDMDIEALKEILNNKQLHVPVVMMTITNNTVCGQPVSMQNIRAVSQLCHDQKIPFFLDACRFAENAWFIKTRESGYKDKSPLDIAKEMFSYADGCTMSAKKDGISNIGGFLATNICEWAEKFKVDLVLNEGFPTYGGMAGRDLEAVAVGLTEALNETYLQYRIENTRMFGEMLFDIGVPVVLPIGGHAIYIDAVKMLPHIPLAEFPAWALNCALYIEGGVRGTELGSVTFGGHGDKDILTPREFVRLAIPRRVYTLSQLQHVVFTFQKVMKNKELIPGMRIIKEPPCLRNFTATFEPTAKGANYFCSESYSD